MTTVTQQLRKAIDQSEMSRYRICQLTGIDKARMSRFMAGGNLSLEQLDRICEVLNLQLTKGNARKGR